MADVFDKEKRSQVMSQIRSSGTKPERLLFLLLRDILGGRRKIMTNVRLLPGNPDFVVPSLRIAIFVDGCFYHGCPLHGHIPKSNVNYWQPKLLNNVSRDGRNRRKLRYMGYSVWRVWEHDLICSRVQNTRQKIQNRLMKKLSKVA